MTDNRKKLEEAALNSVQRNGFNALSFRTLADDVGIKSSSVHYHFPEKSDLARTLIERYSETFFQSLYAINERKWGLRRKVRAFIDIFENVAAAKKLCLCGMMASEVEQLDDVNRELLNSYFINTENWLIQLFNDNRDDLNTELNSRILAKSLFASLQGALLLDRVVQDGNRLKAQKELFMSFIK